MTSELKPNRQITRHAILQLLSAAETARVNATGAGPALTEGAEYIDLQHLSLGIQRMHVTTQDTIGESLPRGAVEAATWSKIREQLANSEGPK